MKKHAFMLNTEATPFASYPDHRADWTSKYASLSFAQVANNLPSSGINEHGLVVEALVLKDGEYPKKADRGAK